MSEVSDEPNGEASEATSPREADATSESTGSVDEEPETLPLDQVFGILKNERRRRVLEYLQDTEAEEVALGELAEEIAALENEKTVDQISSSERKRVYVGLYQCHLPKMDSMGVVSFNKPRGLVELGENVDVFYEYLDTADESTEEPWYLYSLWLSVVGVGGFCAALVTDSMVTLPVVEVVVGVTVLAFLLYAVFALHVDRGETTED